MRFLNMDRHIQMWRCQTSCKGPKLSHTLLTSMSRLTKHIYQSIEHYKTTEKAFNFKITE